MPADVPTEPAVRGRGTTETVLRLFADCWQPSMVLVASLRRGHLLIEESSSGTALGERLRPPAAFVAERGASIEIGADRLPLGWTQVCGWRPGFVATEPVPMRPLQLVVAGAGDPPSPDALAEAAAVVGQLLGREDTTARGHSPSSRIAALIDSLSLPIVFVDSRTVEVFLNEPARILLAITSDEASESEIAAAFARMVVTARHDHDQTLVAASDTDMTFDIETAGRSFAVESRWIDEDRLTGRLWMFRDVTDEREAARFQDELVSTVSHELRTPLTSIMGSIGLLRSGAAGVLPDQANRLVDVASRNGDRLMRIVNDLLDLDKHRAGGIDLHKQMVDLPALLKESIAQNEPYAGNHGVALALELPPWPICTELDPSRMLQVMANLVSNAAKFSPSGSVVRVVLETRDRIFRIKVIDTGPGINPDFRERLFKRFSQDSSDAQTTGAGLGLAICKDIIEAHGGTIGLDPTSDAGATFFVDLPIRSS